MVGSPYFSFLLGCTTRKSTLLAKWQTIHLSLRAIKISLSPLCWGAIHLAQWTVHSLGGQDPNHISACYNVQSMYKFQPTFPSCFPCSRYVEAHLIIVGLYLHRCEIHSGKFIKFLMNAYMGGIFVVDEIS